MITVVDVENSVTRRADGKIDGTPFNPNNFLVSVGFTAIDEPRWDGKHYLFFRHNHLKHLDPLSRRIVQKALDETTLLVGHNIKHDLGWLLESGFEYDGELYDTMVGEYVLARGLKWDLSLDATAIRRGAANKKSSLIDDYWKQGIGFEAMPMEVVEEYGIADIQATKGVFLEQQRLYQMDRNIGLVPTLQMSNELVWVLTDIWRNGIAIDTEALNLVKREYQQEKQSLETSLNEIVNDVMGDTPVNLGSSEQLSTVIYSRKVKVKKEWATLFNIGTDDRGKPLKRPKLNTTEFGEAVRKHTEKVYKTRARQCDECEGKGSVFKTKKNGTPFKKANACQKCGGCGILYDPLPHYAGLRMSPRNIFDVSTGGFSTDKETLSLLSRKAAAENKKAAADFLTSMVRFNAIDTYLSSFVGGIERSMQANGILHFNLNQTVTSTGRLSSSDPNFQNQPRGNTFPVRRAIKSRWLGGTILEGDYAQLEFRGAGELSRDPQIIQDILDHIDVHVNTSKALTDAGQPTNRQGAKPHTFKPLYGGTSGTEAEVAYYTWFGKRYARLTKWHEELQNQAIQYKVITLPTGRQYAFPEARRLPWGGSSFATQIKNYPVQGFATGDLVPCAAILLRKSMRANKVKSLFINTVHDSLVVDVYPGEEALMVKLMREAMLGVVADIERRYGFKMVVPIEVELKTGPNWLDTKVINDQ